MYCLYIVSSGTLNSTIPYHMYCLCACVCPSVRQSVCMSVSRIILKSYGRNSMIFLDGWDDVSSNN